MLGILEKEEFIEKITDETSKNKFKLTEKGNIANSIQELSSLAMADILHNRLFDTLSPVEFISVLSCFAPISLPSDQKVVSISQIVAPEIVKNTLKNIQESYNKYKDIELNNKLYFNQEHSLSWDMAELIIQWCKAENDIEAKIVYGKALEYGITLGEFTKCVLKINNVSNELEKSSNYSVKYDIIRKNKTGFCVNFKISNYKPIAIFVNIKYHLIIILKNSCHGFHLI